MLRRRNKSKTYLQKMDIAGSEAVFELKAMSLDDARELLLAVTKVDYADEDSAGHILDLVAGPIVCIDGIHDETPRAILGDLEFNEDLRAIINGLISYSMMSREEAENLDLSSEPPTQVSATVDVVIVASDDRAEKPEDEPALTTLTKTEP